MKQTIRSQDSPQQLNPLQYWRNIWRKWVMQPYISLTQRKTNRGDTQPWRSSFVQETSSCAESFPHVSGCCCHCTVTYSSGKGSSGTFAQFSTSQPPHFEALQGTYLSQGNTEKVYYCEKRTALLASKYEGARAIWLLSQWKKPSQTERDVVFFVSLSVLQHAY